MVEDEAGAVGTGERQRSIALVDDDRNILTTLSIALQAEGYATRVKEIPAIAALSPATVAANIEAAPVVDYWKRSRRRSLDGHIGCRCRSGGHDNCREADSGG